MLRSSLLLVHSYLIDIPPPHTHTPHPLSFFRNLTLSSSPPVPSPPPAISEPHPNLTPVNYGLKAGETPGMQLIRPLSGWPQDHKKVTDSSGCVTFSADDPFPAGKVGCGPPGAPGPATCKAWVVWGETHAETCARGTPKGAGAQASSSACASWDGVWCEGLPSPPDDKICKSGTCSSTNEECITPPYHDCGTNGFNGYQNAGTNFYNYGDSAPQTSYELDVRN